MERHDEVVDRTRARDVEQPPPLGVAHLLVDRLELVVDVVAISAGEGPRPGWPHDASRRAALRLGGEPRHDGDRELEALGGVDRHDPHGDRGRARAGSCRRCDPPTPGAAPTPGSGGRRARRRRPTPAPGRSRSARDATRRGHRDSRARRRERDVRRRSRPAGRRASATRSESAIERTWAMASATGWSASASGGGAQMFHRPPRRHPFVQLDVAAAVERAAQRRHERQLVGGVVGGAQRQHQVTDLGGRVHDRAVLGPVRDATLAEGRLERRQRCAGREQDGDVAGPAGS